MHIKQNIFIFWISAMGLLSAKSAAAQDKNVDLVSLWQKTAEFARKIQDLDPRVIVDTVPINNIPYAIDLALYDRKKSKIYLHFLTMADNLKALRADIHGQDYIKRYEVISDINKLEEFIDNSNLALIIQYIHEARHARNDEIVSKIGFSIEEMLKFFFIDEISARAEELMFRRMVFLRTGSLEKAFAGTPISKFPVKKSIYIYKSEPVSYADWLHKHRDVSNSITQEEIEVIISCATDMYAAVFGSDLDNAINASFADYRINFGIYSLFNHKIKNSQESKLSDYKIIKPSMAAGGFEQSVFLVFNDMFQGYEAKIPYYEVEKMMSDEKIAKFVKKIQGESESVSADAEAFCKYHNIGSSR